MNDDQLKIARDDFSKRWGPKEGRDKLQFHTDLMALLKAVRANAISDAAANVRAMPGRG